MVAGIVYGFVRFFTGRAQRSALEAANAREQAAVVLERQRIAREMHDHVAQTLFYLTVKLRETRELLSAGDEGKVLTELRESEEHLKEAHQQVRTVISDLKQQADLEDFGEASRRTVAQTAARLGISASCEISGGFSVPDASRQHLLAIIQEALANARQHGHARQAGVRVQENRDGLIVEVSDDGSGFDPEMVPGNGGYGLTIMAERARMAGGSLIVDSAPNRGARVMVRIPGGER